MRDPRQTIFNGFALVLGALVGVALGPVARADSVALADSEELADSVALAGAEELAAPLSTPEAAAAPLTGPQVYTAVCVACHAPPGVGGAPALGDGDAWAARLAQGADTLIDHALHGFSGDKGVMPSKGGRLDLSDEEIVAAVEHMLEQVAR